MSWHGASQKRYSGPEYISAGQTKIETTPTSASPSEEKEVHISQH